MSSELCGKTTCVQPWTLFVISYAESVVTVKGNFQLLWNNWINNDRNYKLFFQESQKDEEK